ncbi:hypothetical protein [Nocardia sp. NPDC127526]|uniref:hypothetical protein n=1 Tax=Nocardia sp. NPDC127526 TaxID=3345393 RepID=UPI00362A50B3
MSEVRELPLSYVLNDVATGDGHSWQQEFRWLWTHDTGKMLTLVQSIAENGIYKAIEIGKPAGGDPEGRPRMWGGHHRVAAAVALQLPTIPVRFYLEAAAA